MAENKNKSPFAPEVSLIPKSREQGKNESSFAPEVSLVPKSREQGQKDAQDRITYTKQVEGFDVDFRSELDPILKEDPIARVGYLGDVEYLTEGYDHDRAVYVAKGVPQSKVDDLSMVWNQGEPIKHDSVAYTPGYASSPAVISHEMRHRGIERIRDYYEEDPDYFEEKYGREAAMVIKFSTLANLGERITEEGDLPFKDHTWLDAHGLDQGTKTLSDTIEEMENYDKDLLTTAYAGLSSAAQDMLEKQGEPVRATPQPKEVIEQGTNWLTTLLDKGKGLLSTYTNSFEKQLENMPEGFAEGGIVEEQPEEESLTKPRLKEDFTFNPSRLPAGASDRDPVVGMDEDGNILYRMDTGKTYFIREAREDEYQKPLTENLAQGAVRLGDWIKGGAELPTLSQVGQAAKSVVQGAYDTVDRAVHGEATLGEVAGMAPVMGAAGAMTKVPKGSLTSGLAQRADINDILDAAILKSNAELERPFKQKRFTSSEENKDLLRKAILARVNDDPKASGPLLTKVEERFGSRGSLLVNNSVKKVRRNKLFSTLQKEPTPLPRQTKLKENPLYRERKVEENPSGNPTGWTNVGSLETPYVFYSPIRQTVENMHIPKSGVVSGKAVLDEFQRVINKGQGIRQSDLSATDLKELIDPTKKYTHDEIKTIVEQNTWEVRPQIVAEFETTQRQKLNVEQDEYFEIDLVATKPEGGTFSPKEQRLGVTGTHYTDRTVAHVRASVKKLEDGTPFILVEEFQSDLMAKGGKPKVKGGPPKATPETLKPQIQSWIQENYPHDDRKMFEQDLTEVLNRVVEDQNFSYSHINSIAHKIQFERSGLSSPYFRVKIADAVEEFQPLLEQTKSIKDVPFKNPDEWVRLTVLSTIAEAQRRGVKYVAIPEPKDMAKYRASMDPNGIAYYLPEKQHTSFNKIYGKSFDKVVRQVEEELGSLSITKKHIEGHDYGSNHTKMSAVQDAHDQIFEWFARYGKGEVSVETLENSTPSEFIELLWKHNIGDQALATHDTSELFDALNYLRKYTNETEGSNVRWLDISELPDLSKSEMRFAQGGFVDNLSPNAFRDYLEGDNMGKYADKIRMAQGGFMGDGVKTEPTTGNKVPPGSLAHEVADDIDIKVSGGEYVLPADVVQYWGLDKIENQIVKPAQSNLQELANDGRIGGQPTSPLEDELPFSDEDLMIIPQPQGFDEGGMVSAPFQPVYQPPIGKGGSYALRGVNIGGYQTRVYVNQAGQTLNVMFHNGQPQGTIPAGFYPMGQVPTEADKAVDPTQNLNQGLDLHQSGESQGDYSKTQQMAGVDHEPVDLTTLSIDELGKKAKFGDLAMKGLKLAGIAIPGVGMVVAAIGSQILGAQNRALIDEIDRRLTDTNLTDVEKKNLETYKEKIADDVGGLLGKTIDKITDLTKKAPTSIEETNIIDTEVTKAVKDIETSTTTSSILDDDPFVQPSKTETVSPTDFQYDSPTSGGEDYDYSSPEDMQDAYEEAAGVSGGTQSTQTTQDYLDDFASYSPEEDTSIQDYYDDGSGSVGYSKGGLVKRRKKK